MPTLNLNVNNKVNFELGEKTREFITWFCSCFLRLKEPRIIFKQVDYYDSLIKIGGEITMLGMEVRQRADAAIQALDREGNPAPLENINWKSQDESIATVEVSLDPTQATIRSVGLGNTVIEVSGDARIGDGVKPINGALLVSVYAPEARTIEITASEPVDE